MRFHKVSEVMRDPRCHYMFLWLLLHLLIMVTLFVNRDTHFLEIVDFWAKIGPENHRRVGVFSSHRLMRVTIPDIMWVKQCHKRAIPQSSPVPVIAGLWHCFTHISCRFASFDLVPPSKTNMKQPCLTCSMWR